MLPDTIRMNRSLIREGVFDIDDIESLISRDVCRFEFWRIINCQHRISQITTPHNRAALLRRLARAQTAHDFGPHFGPCEGVHPWLDRCRDVPLDRFVSVFRWMFPIYGALHVVPMVLFKRKLFFRQPFGMLFRAILGTMRSSAFLGVFVIIYQSA